MCTENGTSRSTLVSLNFIRNCVFFPPCIMFWSNYVIWWNNLLICFYFLIVMLVNSCIEFSKATDLKFPSSLVVPFSRGGALPFRISLRMSVILTFQLLLFVLFFKSVFIFSLEY